MALKEARFSFRHDNCWLQETTERDPTVTLVISSIYMLGDEIHIDLLAHSPDPGAVPSAYEAWGRDPRISRVSKIYESDRGTRFHAAYMSAHSIYPRLIQHTPLSMGAISMASGTEHYTMVGEPEDINDLLRDLATKGQLSIESVRDLHGPADPIESGFAERLLRSLTDKQIEALLLAYVEGYYHWPRSLSASQLATRLGLSNSAFLDHLRRAEAKSLETLIDEMRAVDPARFDAVRASLAARESKAKVKA